MTGVSEQADTIKLAATVVSINPRNGFDMWLLFLEMCLALGLIVFIMWWTLRARVDPPQAPPDEADGTDEKD